MKYIIIGIILGWSASVAFGQAVGGNYSEIQTISGTGSIALGYSSANLGDVNGDGVPDFALGAIYESVGGLYVGPGAVHVFSGADWSLIYKFWGEENQDEFGHAVAAAGDVNADGFQDILIGAWNAKAGIFSKAGSAYVYSGADGSLLHQIDGFDSWQWLGHSVAGLGDLDGDGHDDFIVGASGVDQVGKYRAGAAYVYSGRTGALLHEILGTADVDFLGSEVSGTEDMDGDGVNDFLIASTLNAPYGPHGPQRPGSVQAFSGVTGALITEWHGVVAGGFFGFSISTSGDLNGDGIHDLVVGAPFEEGPSGTYHAGAAYVFSGATGALLHHFQGDSLNGGVGGDVVISQDANGDGVPDLLISQPGLEWQGTFGAGSASLYSGGDWKLLQRWSGEEYSEGFGGSVADLGDLDGDGLSEWVITAAFFDAGGVNAAGQSHFYSFNPILKGSLESISHATGGTLDLLLDFPDSEAGRAYGILISGTGVGPSRLLDVKVPLTQDSIFRRVLSGQFPPMLQGGFGTLDANGDASASFVVPFNAPLGIINTTRWFAAMSFDPGMGDIHMVSVAVPFEITP